MREAREAYIFGMLSELVIIVMVYGAYLLNLDVFVGTLVLQAGVVFVINLDIKRREKEPELDE